MVRERERVVALARAHDRGVGQVLVEEVDPQGVLPVADPLLVGEGQVPAAGAVRLGHRPLVAALVGRAADLADRAGVAELGVRGGGVLVHQDVDAGHMGIGGHGQVVRGDARPRPLVLPIVPGEDELVVRGIGVVRLGPVLDEQVEERCVEVVADALPAPDLVEEPDELRLEIIAPARLERLEKDRGVVHGLAAAGRGDLGLVLEDAGNGQAEFPADHALVGVEGQVEELLGDVLAHDVDIGEAAVPRRRGGVDDIEDKVRGRVAPRKQGLAGDVLEPGQGPAQDDEGRRVELRRRRTVEFPHPQPRAAGVGHGRGDVAAGESRGVGILVIEPDLEAEALPDLDGIGAERKPLVGEIGRDEPGAWMDEGAADAAGLEVLEIALDLLPGHQVVPDPERSAAVFGRRVGEHPEDGRIGGALRLPGARQAGRNDGQDECDGYRGRKSTHHFHVCGLSLSVGNCGAGRRMPRKENIRPQI